MFRSPTHCFVVRICLDLTCKDIFAPGMQRPKNLPRSVRTSSLAVLFPPCRAEHESMSPRPMGMMMHESRTVLTSFDQTRRLTVDTDLSCSVLCPC